MPRLRDILERWRPAGAPGSAGGVGVPSDRLAAVAQELEPVFAALAEVEQACHRLGEEAQEAAAARLSEAGGQARTLIARGRVDAEAERAAAAARVRELVSADIAHLAAEAEKAADEVRRAAASHRSQQLARVMARVRADLEAVSVRETTP